MIDVAENTKLKKPASIQIHCSVWRTYLASMKSTGKNQESSRQERARLLAAKAKQLDAAPDEEEKEEDKGTTLLIAFLAMLVFSLGNRVFGKLYTYPMHNYPLYMNLLSTVMYVPMCFLYIVPVQMFTNWIGKEQTSIPKKDFLIMGALDSVSSIMSTFAVNYVPSASLIVLVQQSAIPITMAISKMTLGARYTNAQYVGAGIVLSGIALVLSPTFLSTAEPAPGESGQLFWLAVLVLSCIPACLSSVYKEKALGEVDIDVVYLNGWVAIFQTLIAIPLSVPSASVTGLAMNEILPNLYGGLLCSVGINSVEEAHGTYQVDDCQMGPLFVGIFLFFNIFYNLLIVVVLKYGSANILYMCFTIIVPLSNVAFSLKITPGHKPLQTMDIVGLVVIMSGLIVYRFSGALYSFYTSCTEKVSEEELAIRKQAKRIGAQSEKKQTKLIGFNQLESLNAMIDSRVMTAQRSQLFRSPAQVRGDLFMKLGIPPSPHVSMGPGGRFRDMQQSTPSPQIYSKMLNMPKFKSPRAGSSPRANYGRNIGRQADKQEMSSLLPKTDNRSQKSYSKYGSNEV